jgi:hypothetical protein
MIMIYKDSQVSLIHFTTDQQMTQEMRYLIRLASGVMKNLRMSTWKEGTNYAVYSVPNNTTEKTSMSQSYDWC